MEENEIDYLNVDNQKRLVKKCLEDHKFFSEVEHIIEYTDFNDPLSEYIRIIKDYYHQNRRSPNLSEFIAHLDSENHEHTYNIKEVKDYIVEIKNIDISDIENKDWWVNNMVGFVKKSRTIQMLHEGVDWLDKNSSSNKDYEYFAKQMSEINNLSVEKNEIHDWKKDALKRFVYFGDYSENRIQSNIEMLNAIGFGDYEALSLFLGETNIGKTLYLANYVATALRNRYNVVVFTMEDGVKKWTGRVDQNILDMTRDELLRKGKEVLPSFKQKVLDNFGDLKVISLPTGTGNVTMMREFLDQLINEGFKPDLIVADYLGIMSPTQKYNNSYEKYKMVAEEFRALVQEYKAAGLSAQQFNRGAFGADGGKKKSPGLDSVQDSIGIPQTADAIVTIVTFADDANNKHLLSPEKSRSIDKRKVKPTIVMTDTDRQRIISTDPIDQKEIPKEVKKEIREIHKSINKPTTNEDEVKKKRVLPGAEKRKKVKKVIPKESSDASNNMKDDLDILDDWLSEDKK